MDILQATDRFEAWLRRKIPVVEADLASLLYCMGWETANIHLGSPKMRKVLSKALHLLPKTWLGDAAQTMFDKNLKDWQIFKNSNEKRRRA